MVWNLPDRMLLEGAASGEQPVQRLQLRVVAGQSHLVPAFSFAQRVVLLFPLPSASSVPEAAVGGGHRLADDHQTAPQCSVIREHLGVSRM